MANLPRADLVFLLALLAPPMSTGSRNFVLWRDLLSRRAVVVVVVDVGIGGIAGVVRSDFGHVKDPFSSNYFNVVHIIAHEHVFAQGESRRGNR